MMLQSKGKWQDEVDIIGVGFDEVIYEWKDEYGEHKFVTGYREILDEAMDKLRALAIKCDEEEKNDTEE